MVEEASLQTLPSEVRLEIFKHLLSWRYTAIIKVDPTEIEPSKDSYPYLGYDFQLAIMRVNKAISMEAMDYFQSENAFVAFEAEDDFTYLSGAIPMITTFKRNPLWGPAAYLRAAFPTYSPESGLDHPHQVLIAGPHVASFAHIFNAETSTSDRCKFEDERWRHLSLQMSVEDNPRRPPFLQHARPEPLHLRHNAKSMLAGLHCFRGIEAPRFAGPIDSALARSLAQAWKRPALTFNGSMVLCASEAERAHAFLARADAHGARMAFAVASYVLRRATWEHGAAELHWQTSAFRRAYARLRAATGLGLYTAYRRLGERRAALVEAFRTVEDVDEVEGIHQDAADETWAVRELERLDPGLDQLGTALESLLIAQAARPHGETWAEMRRDALAWQE